MTMPFQSEDVNLRRKESNPMHYANGRPANNGDKVIVFSTYGAPYIGILYDAQQGNDTCNGKVAVTSTTDPMPNLKECLHIDDVKGVITDLSKVPQTV